MVRKLILLVYSKRKACNRMTSAAFVQVLSPHRRCSLCCEFWITTIRNEMTSRTLHVGISISLIFSTCNSRFQAQIDFVNKPNFAESVTILVPLASRTPLLHCRIELNSVLSRYCACNSRKSRYRLWGKEYFLKAYKNKSRNAFTERPAGSGHGLMGRMVSSV
jgi:hypothetical protein